MIELTHNHRCNCGETISGYDSDSRSHLARQIGGSIDDSEDEIRCHCGETMTCDWILLDGDTGDESEVLATGWNSEPKQREINLAKGRMVYVSQTI
mgnify:CR=1 FL=1